MPPFIIKILVYLGAAALLAGSGFIGGVRYVRGQEARAIVKEVKKEEAQHDRDVGTVVAEGSTYDRETSAPLNTPAPSIRVCPAPRKVPPASPAGPKVDAAGPLRGDDTQIAPAIVWDSTPTVVAGRDADAQVAGLQDYIVRVCRPKL